MTTKPSHRAYLVADTEPEEGKKGRWTEVGAVWPHRDGEGFDIVLPTGLAVFGRLVCRPIDRDTEV